MSIVIVGGGAIGLLVAARLAQSQQRVALLARPAMVEALRSQSITMVQRKTEQTIASPPAAAEPAALPAEYQRPDLAILCVKGYDTVDALTTLEALQPEQVLTLQNGIGNEEMLLSRLGTEAVFSGAITSSVEVEQPGHIRVTKVGGIGLAPVQDTPGLALWAAVFARAGFVVHTQRDYRALKWSKALLNMLGNATPAVLDMSLKAVYAHPGLITLEQHAFLEALAVMQQRGIRPVNLPAYPVKLLALCMRRLPAALLYPLLRRVVAGGRGGKLPSLHADLKRGRMASEGEYLYGAIARAAHESGLSAPVNTALWQVLHGIATGSLPWEAFRQQPDRLLEVVRQTAAMETAPQT